GPEIEHVVAEAVLDRDRWVERLRLGSEVVLPEDPARLRLERGDEASPRATLVAREGGDDLLERTPGNNQLAVGDDRRSEGEIERVGPGKLLASHAQLPALLSGHPLERVDPTLRIGEEDGVFGHQRRADDAPLGSRSQARDARRLILRLFA